MDFKPTFLGLPPTRLGTFLENRVNDFLRRQNHPESGEVTVRVVHASDKTVEVKPGMKARYVEILLFFSWCSCLYLIMVADPNLMVSLCLFSLISVDLWIVVKWRNLFRIEPKPSLPLRKLMVSTCASLECMSRSMALIVHHPTRGTKTFF